MPDYCHSATGKVPVSLAVAICLLILSCASKTPTTSDSNAAVTLPQVIATVNGRPVPTKVYEMYLKNGREALGIDSNTDEGRRKLDQLREGIVSELIDRALITEAAEMRGLKIPATTMAESEQRAIAELGGEQQYDSYLAKHHTSRDEYRDVIRMQIYGQMLRDELKKGLTVSDKEIEDYYNAHRNEPRFRKPESVTAVHILIAARPNLIERELQQTRNLSGEALAAAVREEMAVQRRRAEDLRRKVVGGANFSALARESSDDPGTRSKGGDLGAFTRDSHPRAFDDAAFSLKPGKVSSVVQTDYGFHIIKVSAHERERTQTLAEATADIRRVLLENREGETLAEWLKDARRKASVHINEPFQFGALKAEFGSN